MLSQALRSWNRTRLVAALAIFAFAIGIGAATAMYTVVNAVLLRPVPYSDGDRLVAIYGADVDEPNRFSANTLDDLQNIERHATGFDAFGIFTSITRSLTSRGDPRHVTVVAVTPAFLPQLGPTPALGSWPATERDAAVSDRLWREIGSDPRIIGDSIVLDGVPFTVTAVMPPRFVFRSPDLAPRAC